MNATLTYDDELVRWSIELAAATGPTTTLTHGDVTLYAAADELVGIVVDAPLGTADPDRTAESAIAALVGSLDLRHFRGRIMELEPDPACAPARRATALAVASFVDDPSEFSVRLESCPSAVRAVLPTATRRRTAVAVPAQVLASAWVSQPGVVDVVSTAGAGTHAGSTRLVPRPEVRGVIDLSIPARVHWTPASGSLHVEIVLADGAVPDDVRDLWLRVARADDGITVAATPLEADGDLATADAVLADADLAGVVLDVTDQPFEPAGTAADRTREQAVALMQLASDLDGDDADALWSAAARLFERLGDRPRAEACRARAHPMPSDRAVTAEPVAEQSRSTRRGGGAGRGRSLAVAAMLAALVSGAAVWWAGHGSGSDPSTPDVVSTPPPSNVVPTTAPAPTVPPTTVPPTTVPPTTVPPTTSVAPSTTAAPGPALSAGPVRLTTPGGGTAIASIDGTLRFHAGDTVAVSVQADQVPMAWTFGHLADCASVAGSTSGADVSGATGDGPQMVPSFSVVASALADDGTIVGRYVMGSVEPSHQMTRFFVTAEACAAGAPVDGGTQVQGFVRLAPVVAEVTLPADLAVGRVVITVGDDSGDATGGLVIEVTAG